MGLGRPKLIIKIALKSVSGLTQYHSSHADNKLSWRRGRDSNPRLGLPVHDFQSCSFDQLGHLSVIFELKNITNRNFSEKNF